MNFKLFLRDINVSHARNALYTLGSNSPRLSNDPNANGPINRQFETDRSKSDSRLLNTLDLHQSIKSTSSLIVPTENLKNDLEIVEHNAKVVNAGNKIFTAAMICSWRKQRNLIKDLTQQLEETKRNKLKYDHRIHVYDKMYDNEKERNYDLKRKLRESQEELKAVKSKYDALAKSNVTLKASIHLLEQQLLVREEQYEGLQISFNEMQTALFRSMSRERELQRQLSEEQRRVQSYTARENDLKAKIEELKKCDDYKDYNMYGQINLKKLLLIRYKQDNEFLSDSIRALLTKKREIDGIDSRIQNTLNEIMQLKDDIQSLRYRLDHTWANRIKLLWNSTSLFRRRIAETFLTFTFCILPSMPVPTISGLSLFAPLQINYT